MPRVALAASLIAAALGACSNPATGGSDDAAIHSACALETRAEVYQPGMQHACASGTYDIKLVTSTPGPPQKGNNAWLVQIADAQGQPVTGATLQAVPFMPDHGHGTAIVPAITELGSGQYRIDPLDLFMAGLWRVTLTVTHAASSDFSQFYFCIDG